MVGLQAAENVLQLAGLNITREQLQKDTSKKGSPFKRTRQGAWEFDPAELESFYRPKPTPKPIVTQTRPALEVQSQVSPTPARRGRPKGVKNFLGTKKVD